MGKFLQMMSQNDSKTLQARAASINQQAEIAQTNLVNALKQQKAQLELEVQNLTDFAPESTQSLRPGTSNWNPTEWTKKLHNTKVELYETNVQLKIAQETYKEFFGEDGGEAQA